MSGIDYSKWDNLEEYSDSSDDEATPTTPRVTTLDGPSKVTFGGSNSAEIVQQQEQQHPTSSQSGATVKSSSAGAEVQGVSSKMKVKWSDKGGKVTIDEAKDRGKGGGKRDLYWCQDRYSVTIRLQLDNEIKGSELSIAATNVATYEDRHCAVGSTKPHLTIIQKSAPTLSSSQNDIVLLEGDFPHPIHYAYEEDSLEWNIERDEMDQKFLTLMLYKAVPMQGLFVWWKRPFLHFEEIELDASSHQTSNASAEFTKAWEEAHRLFREKRASQNT